MNVKYRVELFFLSSVVLLLVSHALVYCSNEEEEVEVQRSQFPDDFFFGTSTSAYQALISSPSSLFIYFLILVHLFHSFFCSINHKQFSYYFFLVYIIVSDFGSFPLPIINILRLREHILKMERASPIGMSSVMFQV